jgi:hypothetical protein
MRNASETNALGRMLALTALAALIILCIGACAGTGSAESGQVVVSPTQRERIEAMQKKGPDASLTILPVRLAGQPFDRLTEVIGLLFEQKGLKNIELGKSVFNPEADSTLETLADMVGEFIKKNPVATDYAMYAEFNGNRQTGLNESRAIVVDKSGAVLWMDRLGPEDEPFKKLGSPEPMSLSLLCIERAGAQLGLSEETVKAAKPGKMTRLMEERSGLPPQEERSALEERQKELKKVMPTATLLVFPARVGGKARDVSSATDLAGMINNAGLCKASPAGQPILMNSFQADPNEAKVLWDLAREFRDHARKNPSEADYVLFADYGFNPQNWEQGYVHFVVCDRKGEWVLVDLQNSHHPDYQSVKPISRADCDKILVKRLEHYLR